MAGAASLEAEVMSHNRPQTKRLCWLSYKSYGVDAAFFSRLCCVCRFGVRHGSFWMRVIFHLRVTHRQGAGTREE